jgi:group II intron reverse transcriptase/maturase
MRSRQLTFVFADSPQGGKEVEPSDESVGKAHLLRIAKGMPTSDLSAPATETDQLLKRVASPWNLAEALLNVARNKGAPGVDGRSVAEVLEDVQRLLPKLRRALLDGSYQPGDIRRVWIPKPGGGQRGLGIPNVIDRWVQQAVLQVLEPIFEPTFHPSSHGFRPHRGAHTAIAEAKTYIAEGYGVVVDLDLSKFFDRVHHQRLLARLGQRIADQRLIRLIGQMLKAKVVMPDGTRVSTDEGTPQGGPLSPLLSNVVLDEFDWELQRRGLRFVRYADDSNIYVRSERAGQRVMASVRRFLEGRLRLLVNEEKSKVARPAEIHFLGFRLWKTRKGTVAVSISSRTKKRMDQRIRELTPRNWGQSVSACMDGISRYLRGWIGYFRICTAECESDFQHFDAHIRRRLRAIIIRQKKRPRYLFRHLLARGVRKKAAANTAFCHRGVWHKSITRGMHLAYRNAWFVGRLTSLWTSWEQLNPPPSRALVQRLLFE